MQASRVECQAERKEKEIPNNKARQKTQKSGKQGVFSSPLLYLELDVGPLKR